MTAEWVRLPDGWASEDTIAVVDATSCWIWIGALDWPYARKLIAQLHNVPDSNCGITIACVNPLHDESTTRPAGAAS